MGDKLQAKRKHLLRHLADEEMRITPLNILRTLTESVY